ncbi:MAG TPA: DUF547 domain-containing protein [Methylomirabilota bacterium]|nr:DUF547 domain-containing protein [Methylomirabilota bacterium]HZT34378.1 DUF547 domain-containing protein [Nitrososphaera sp.]
MPFALSFFAMALLFCTRPVSAAVDHDLWSTLLTRYVDDNGRVAYRDLRARDKAAFDQYLATLAQARTEGMSEAEEKAFWINAYNAVIISGVLQGYTAESLLGRKRLFSWFTAKVAGQDRTPDEIEHQILRKKFHDPRIHFVAVEKQAMLNRSDSELRYLEYDWTLNAQEGQRV